MYFGAENMPSDELIKSVSCALAHAYACGWDQHARCFGEKKGLDPDQWAKENTHMFTQEAVEALMPKE